MATENKPTKELTLILVDDDDVDAMGVERALKKLKILNPVARARNGIEGLEILRDTKRAERPFLVLLDINMPQMNGLEMLAEVRKDEMLADAIVFVLTTSKADEDRIEAYKLNVAGYIVKSQMSNGILSIIEMLDHYWRVIELPV